MRYILTMNLIRQISALASLIAITGGMAQAAPNISSLAEGDVVSISYETHGCFEYHKASLVITDNQIRVDDRMTYPLTAETAQNLETYFTILDGNPLGTCTSSDVMEVTLTRADGTSDSWDYIDSRCLAENASAEKGLSISNLLYRIEDKSAGL